MQFPTIAVLLSALTGLVSAQSSSMGMSMSSSSAWMNSTITMTTVVTAFTTYCPSPTLLTYNDVVITVTEATMITVTNCPCTLTSVMLAPACPPTTMVMMPTGGYRAPTMPPSPTYVAASGAASDRLNSILGAVASDKLVALGAALGAVVVLGAAML